MTRVPAYLDNRFGRYPRTTAEAFGLSPHEAQAIHHYPRGLQQRVLRAITRLCLLGMVVGGALALAGCDDVSTIAAGQADLIDARAQARAEWHAQARALAQLQTTGRRP